ncbi:hypothetical protein [Streptomyces sp. ICBB 8177]|uniref:hypothetical protein n=1 Tax=Streptomyces sp. ICBB 8177 TaxID=563922 RepID=UPI0011B43FC8|nr:hypothetical protein [Streptomyces sp. ICBB 8177]
MGTLAARPGGHVSSVVRSAAAGACTRPEQTVITRTSACHIHTEEVRIADGKLSGVLTVTTGHDMALDYKSTQWKDNVSIRFDSYVGDAPIAELAVGLEVTCGSATCKAIPGPSLEEIPVEPGEGATGAVMFSDAVTTIDSFKPSFTFVSVAGLPGRTGVTTFPTIRCDNELAKRVGAGCVFPGTTPVLTQMAQLPGIAVNIRRAQQGGAPGNPHTAKPVPLHFHYSATKQKNNRDAVCPGGV